MSDRVFRIPLPGWSRSLPGRLRGLESGFLLREFLAGDENEIVAGAIFEQFARREPTARALWHPLVFYGSPGVGKSHLARGSALAWHRQRPTSAVTYRLAGDFVRDTSSRQPAASAAGDQATEPPSAPTGLATPAPRAPAGATADTDAADGIFVLEHLEHLASQERAQEKLLRLLDRIDQAGGLAIITSRIAPERIAGLENPLRSRLSAGLTLRVDRPGAPTRVALLEELAAAKSLRLTPDGADLLATRITGTARDLASALTHLDLQNPTATQAAQSIGRAEVEQYFDLVTPVTAPSLLALTSAAARYFALRAGDIRGPSRRRTVALARRISMFLAREHTACSLAEIGRYYGGRDHSTVSYACSETQRRFDSDSETRAAVSALRETLQV